MKSDLLNLLYKIIKMNYSYYSIYSIYLFFRDTLFFEIFSLKSFKVYLRYKMITSLKISETLVKNSFILEILLLVVGHSQK